MQHKDTSIIEDRFSALYHLLKASPFHDLTNYLKNNEKTIKQFLALANAALDQKTTNINTIPFTDAVCNEVFFHAV